ncbi:MAG: hypothetical protein HUJ25_00080 [Crocinitomicaceae bacterium]|nr:hypothetical protein [Crocinitomicaceae bacterium]
MAKYLDQILEPLEQLKTEVNGKLTHKESSWYNGRAYFPYHIITLTSDNAILSYEYRVSDFSKSNFMNPDDEKDRHNFTFESISKNETKSYKATIRTTYSLFNRKRKPVFKISCKDSKFSRFLKTLSILEDYYDNSLNSSEFEPVIYVRSKNGRTTVNIYFMLPCFEIDIVRQTYLLSEAIMKFCDAGVENAT